MACSRAATAARGSVGGSNVLCVHARPCGCARGGGDTASRCTGLLASLSWRIGAGSGRLAWLCPALALGPPAARASFTPTHIAQPIRCLQHSPTSRPCARDDCLSGGRLPPCPTERAAESWSLVRLAHGAAGAGSTLTCVSCRHGVTWPWQRKRPSCLQRQHTLSKRIDSTAPPVTLAVF